MGKKTPEIVVEVENERLYYTSGLTHRAWRIDAPHEIGRGVDEQHALATLDCNYPRATT